MGQSEQDCTRPLGRYGIVFVTHDIDESVYLGERVVVLSASPTVLHARDPGRAELPVALPARRRNTDRGGKAIVEQGGR